MIIVLKKTISTDQLNRLINEIESDYNVTVHPVVGEQLQVLGLVGDTSSIDETHIQAHEYVDKLIHIQEPYKRANKLFHPEATQFSVNGINVGEGNFNVIAGPCSVESLEQMRIISTAVKASGAQFIRGGAFKPRTSPYAFQGMGLDGLEILKEIREETGMPIVTELMSTKYLDEFVADVDVIQVGARNMQNFDMLKELGKTKKPILLKRGLSATIEELLMSAEYIMAEGNENIILCERGIRTYETYTRNTLDISAVPVLKKLSHLPVFVDPSHAGGSWDLVKPLSLSALAAGADGVMIEVHNNPEKALSDGQQSVRPELFDEIMTELKAIAGILNKKM